MSGERNGTLRFLAIVIASAVSAGVTVITGTVLAVDALSSAAGPGNLDLRFYLLLSGTLSGILLAGFLAWRLLGPIESTYRRGGLAMVCAFATVIVMLACIPVNQLLGQEGLIALLAFLGVGAALLARHALRLRQQA